MKAMIFAAGLGTRLRPLTDTIPKAMVPVGGIPMLQRVIEHGIAHGIDEIIINVHYLSKIIVDFLQEKNHFGIQIHISDESEELLETGGGLVKAKLWLEGNKPFLVCNADVLTNINITEFFAKHRESRRLATLAVRKRNSSRQLLFDATGRLCGRSNQKTNTLELKYPTDTENISEYAFSGYHIIEPEIFKLIKRSGKFSITDAYLDLCAEQDIQAYVHNDDVWVDIGSLEKLKEAEIAAAGL
jgi:NDP-sugar pyrophosphorylase family protein